MRRLDGILYEAAKNFLHSFQNCKIKIKKSKPKAADVLS
jgi:hypothetical protein